MEGLEKVAGIRSHSGKSLSEKAPRATVRVLNLLAIALKKPARRMTPRPSPRIENPKSPDKEYDVKMPGFKGTVYNDAKPRPTAPSSWNIHRRHLSPASRRIAFDVLQNL